MSQPNPKFSDFDYNNSARERRGPAPITNLPVNALSGDIDPTRELRALIEQLQNTARDARDQARVAEGQRDDIAAQLEQARRQNEDLRAHFVEITSLIRERDNAVAEAERLNRALGEAQARVSTVQREAVDAQRQRDELVRARDEAIRAREEIIRSRDDSQRQLEALTRASQDTNRRFNDVQRQLFTIRQARDASQAQNTELTQKLNASKERIAELQDKLDFAESAVEEARTQAVDPEEFTALRQERDDARRQIDAASEELHQLRSKLTEITEQKATALETGNGHAAALMVANEEISRLKNECEHARMEIEARERLIEEIRTNPDEAVAAELEQARLEILALKNQREGAEMRVQFMTKEVMEMRQQMQARAEQISSIQRDLEEATQNMAQTRSQFEQLDQERSSAISAKEQAVASLTAAQKQIDRIIRDRDLIRQQSTENSIAMEAQIEALNAQLAAYEACDPEAGIRTAEVRNIAERLTSVEDERRELAARLEKQRAETIDLGAQLQSAQDQIRELSASLAEMRLQNLSAGRGSVQRRTPPTTSPAAPLRAGSPAVEIFDAGATVLAMRHSFQAFSKNPGELRQLSELANHAQVYSELARTSGLIATQRMSAAFASLSQELYHYPEQVTPTILRTLQQGIEFLATLPKLSNLPQAKDPANAIIYAVDDDANSCECIRMSMETAMAKTISQQDPAKALVELGSTACDLIFLDISMPGINGFELCASIRNLALHALTPVVFLSGLTTAENRVQSNLSGGNDFVGKPFMLNELTVKALMLMMKSQLHLA